VLAHAPARRVTPDRVLSFIATDRWPFRVSRTVAYVIRAKPARNASPAKAHAEFAPPTGALACSCRVVVCFAASGVQLVPYHRESRSTLHLTVDLHLFERLGFQVCDLLFGGLAEGSFELIIDPIGGKKIQTLLRGGKGKLVLPTRSIAVCEAVMRV
jgi:hypothetical protein